MPIHTIKSNLKFPDWFKPEIGFHFWDPDGDEAVYLGVSGYRRTEHVPVKTVTDGGKVIRSGVEEVVEFVKNVDVFVIKYKNEWLTSDFQRNLIETPDYLDQCKPIKDVS